MDRRSSAEQCREPERRSQADLKWTISRRRPVTADVRRLLEVRHASFSSCDMLHTQPSRARVSHRHCRQGGRGALVSPGRGRSRGDGHRRHRDPAHNDPNPPSIPNLGLVRTNRWDRRKTDVVRGRLTRIGDIQCRTLFVRRRPGVNLEHSQCNSTSNVAIPYGR